MAPSAVTTGKKTNWTANTCDDGVENGGSETGAGAGIDGEEVVIVTCAGEEGSGCRGEEGEASETIVSKALGSVSDGEEVESGNVASGEKTGGGENGAHLLCLVAATSAGPWDREASSWAVNATNARALAGEAADRREAWVSAVCAAP